MFLVAFIGIGVCFQSMIDQAWASPAVYLRVDLDKNQLWPQLAKRRSSSSSCYARYRLGDRKIFCLSRTLYRSLLNSQGAPPIHGVWKGKWKTYLPPSEKKKVPQRAFYFFRATQLIRAIKKPPIWQTWVESKRERLSVQLKKADAWGVWRKLLLNEKVNTDAESILRWSGFVHLYTAAGIHIYALWKAHHFLIFLIRHLPGVRLGSATVWRWAILALNGGMICFLWLLSGLRPGWMRPILLLMTRRFLKCFGVRVWFFLPLVLALVIDLVFWFAHRDLWAWAPGRWHYTLAVGGGLSFLDYYSSKIAKIQNRFLRELVLHGALSIGSWLPIALLEVFTEHQVLWSTPIVSLISIPIIGTLIYPFYCFASLLGSQGVIENLKWLDQLSAWVIEWLFQFTQMMGLCQSVQLSTQKILIILLSLGWFLATAFGIKKLSRFLVSLLAGVSLILKFSHDDQLIQLDVGQGDSALIQSQSRFYLVDTGSYWSLRDHDLIHLRMNYGISKFDSVILTHLDEDHFGNLRRWVDLISINDIRMHPAALKERFNEKWIRSLRERKIPIQTTSFYQNGLEVLPLMGIGKNSNDRSLAVTYRFGFWEYVNLGDVTKKGERLFLEKIWKPTQSPCRLVKVTHHGSRTSSSEAFLSQFNQAVISSGRSNRYGHPAAEVLTRLSQLSLRVHRTDHDGDLKIKAKTQCENRRAHGNITQFNSNI